MLQFLRYQKFVVYKFDVDIFMLVIECLKHIGNKKRTDQEARCHSNKIEFIYLLRFGFDNMGYNTPFPHQKYWTVRLEFNLRYH